MSLPTLRLAPLPTDKALPGSAHIPSVATGVRPHTKRSKIGDRGPVHVGTWYAGWDCSDVLYWGNLGFALGPTPADKSDLGQKAFCPKSTTAYTFAISRHLVRVVGRNIVR